MKVLITGGSGYIGSVLTGVLLDLGYRVVVLDSLIFGQRSLFQYCANPNFEFVLGDARDESKLKELLATVDAIIPLAALVGAPACERDPWFAESVNLGAIKSLNRLRSHQQMVVYPNTNSGYGISDGTSFCTEETPLQPISLYGRTKVDAETELLESGTAVTLRLATVFGMSARMRLDLLVNDFVHQAFFQSSLVLFEKHFKRNFIHVRDVCDAFVFALKNFESMKGLAYNVGLDSANLSKEELAVAIQRFLPRLVISDAAHGKDPDKRNYIVSNQRLREAGFEAKRSLEQGIEELIKGYRMMVREPYYNV